MPSERRRLSSERPLIIVRLCAVSSTRVESGLLRLQREPRIKKGRNCLKNSGKRIQNSKSSSRSRRLRKASMSRALNASVIAGQCESLFHALSKCGEEGFALILVRPHYFYWTSEGIALGSLKTSNSSS